MKRPLWSKKLADIQYWLMLLGALGIFTSLTFAGLIQGEGWLKGEVVYRILPMLSNYFLARGIAGTMFFIGGLIFAINVVMTVLGRRQADEPDAAAEVAS
jgi:cbb3-type cytochrome oxidase subunit 1